MHVILTHEQADFDALASLLGASLLDEQAIPVLPSRMNRNLRAFLALYGAVLPFIDRRELPPGTVETITLVDTQSLVSVRGMQPDTQIKVIDHHPPRSDLPKSWQIVTDETGANTTLFVEELQERGSYLEPIQATLLLLGIYEDTGSLTYSRTTSRDIRAAAFLVEQGASLKIANNYLNHPLSLQQEQLYQELQANAKTQQIHGHDVVISHSDASEMDEELSTIAHKLRNVMEPDALVLLFLTRGGVQMIARSTSDHIDVATLATQFGGGGHPRASAALIKNQELDEVREILLARLNEIVHPAITVAELMSRGPQVLTADTTAVAAAQRMQRYGYEGYPVVEDGQLVGLLTRRAVDRAIAHKLNLSARSMMQAGNVTVLPGDSIEHVQSLMIETGWGQIPVVDPISGDIIGIVTRTDLINTLSGQGNQAGRLNLADKLETSLPPALLALLKVVAQAAFEHRVALYIVGGFVRDLLLDRPSLDLDLVVEGDAIRLGRALQSKFGGRLTSHGRFGTAKWHLGKIRDQLVRKLPQPETGPLIADDLPSTMDLISARTEFYTHPTALPTVEQGSIKLDLHRRDFTINTLALRLDGSHYGELFDYWGGLSDLNLGLVRVLHSISFVDDPTRMLRAVRYEQRYGFQIEERTLQLLSEARPLLERVSGERIRHELDHILEEEFKQMMMTRLAELGLLSQLHPDLTWDNWLDRQFARLDQTPGWKLPPLPRGYPQERALAYTLLLIRLPDRSIQQILETLVYPRNLANQIRSSGSLWRQKDHLHGKKASEISQLLDSMPLLAIYACYFVEDSHELRSKLEQYYTDWRLREPTISGLDLRARGLPPGPEYQKILTRLRAAWLDGEVNTPEEEYLLLEELLHRL
jgi:tRNA nucleotidyltransferase (CCA-adding enzyme)